jgi:hypothetical protein
MIEIIFPWYSELAFKVGEFARNAGSYHWPCTNGKLSMKDEDILSPHRRFYKLVRLGAYLIRLFNMSKSASSKPFL